MVGKPNLVKCFGPRLRLWTWTLDFVPGPSFSIFTGNLGNSFTLNIGTRLSFGQESCALSPEIFSRAVLDFGQESHTLSQSIGISTKTQFLWLTKYGIHNQNLSRLVTGNLGVGLSFG